MRTDVHLSESKVLDQKLIPQILLEFSGHLVSHQNTNNVNYMNVLIAKKCQCIYTPKSHFPSSQATEVFIKIVCNLCWYQ